jgi:hypothetical protein
MCPIPAASDDAAPPEEPPGVILGSRGFLVSPWIRLVVNQDHRAGLAQIVDHRRVGCGNRVALQLDAVGGSETFLVDVDLDGDRHAGQRAHIFVARDRCIDRRRLRQHFLRAMVDHGIDCGVHGIETRKRGQSCLLGRYFLGADQGGEFSGRQTPEVGHTGGSVGSPG